jgi:hypothetical protein
MTEFLPQDATPQQAAHTQAYAQPPWQPAPTQAPAWGAPPAQWNTQPPKKRKAWPWVLGIVGGLVVVGGAGLAVIYGVTGALNADQNENYTGSPITANDAPTLGDHVVLSDDATVAFEIDSDWVDAGDYVDLASLTANLPDGARAMGHYFTADPIVSSVAPTLVLVLEGVPPNQIGPVDLREAHDSAVSGMVEAATSDGLAPAVEDETPVTTSLGLDGLVTATSVEMQGIPVRIAFYTFVRSERVVWIQIATYTGADDAVAASLVTDSLRIDK